MGKTKKRASVADNFGRSKAIGSKPKKLNPFEVHVNKEKFSILGRTLKHDKGMPGVSRSKALKRRKDTLGQEFMNRNKTNKFRDKRIGERSMPKEEAANARFVAEQLNKFKSKKQSLYNLSDDPVLLTHKGQTLAEIEQHEDVVSDGESDEELGKLDANFTSTAHFGGGHDDGDDEARGKDRKAAIEDLIADQKRRKAEISKEKEEIHEMTQILDANWRTLIPLMGKMSKNDEAKPKPDDYDRAMREMIFEPRGSVTDKLRSEEELLKKEKDKLETLEQERRERMEGITEEDKKMKHRSADDLDDGYFLQPQMEINEVLAYDVNGSSKGSDEEDMAEFEKNAKDSNFEDENELKNGNKSSSEEDNENGEEDLEDEESEDDDHDSMEDLKYSSDESDDGNKSASNETKESNKTELNAKSPTKKPQITEEERKKIMDEAAAKLPYTFDLPESYEDLSKLLNSHSVDVQSVIIARMIKCNHPKLVPENKEKMTKLFVYLLQHISDSFEDITAENISKSFRLLTRLNPHLFDIFNVNPMEMTKCFREVIIEKQNDYRENESVYPSIETLIFLKLVSVFYSTSDYKHPIVTPCFVFISQLLTRCKVTTRNELASGLFLVAIILEYTQLSKKFLPAAVNFLQGAIFLSLKKRPIEVHKIVPPFQSIGPKNSLLVLSENFNKNHFGNEYYLKSEDLVKSIIDDEFRVRSLNSVLLMSNDMLTLLSENKSIQYIAQSFEKLTTKIDVDNYPDFLKESLSKLEKTINGINGKNFEFPDVPTRRPKALRMFEPKFDKVYDDKRTRKPEAIPKAIQQGLIRKVKNETRGAIREIRRDNAFLAKVQLKKQLQSDTERREKVKRIFSEASIQQGELNALDRKKKHN